MKRIARGVENFRKDPGLYLDRLGLGLVGGVLCVGALVGLESTNESENRPVSDAVYATIASAAEGSTAGIRFTDKQIDKAEAEIGFDLPFPIDPLPECYDPLGDRVDTLNDVVALEMFGMESSVDCEPVRTPTRYDLVNIGNLIAKNW